MKSLIKKFFLWNLKRKGLDICEDCRVIGFPKFGSEPYLISIGKHVTISSNVRFVTHDGGTFVFRNNKKYKDVIKLGKIRIDDNCFIGADSIILPGVVIGSNSVVGCGSVVTKNVLPNSVVAGNPAKYIMSVDEYAEKCLKNTPQYNIADYKVNKEKELLRIYR